jgi:hypothetical protein
MQSYKFSCPDALNKVKRTETELKPETSIYIESSKNSRKNCITRL